MRQEATCWDDETHYTDHRALLRQRGGMHTPLQGHRPLPPIAGLDGLRVSLRDSHRRNRGDRTGGGARRSTLQKPQPAQYRRVLHRRTGCGRPDTDGHAHTRTAGRVEEVAGGSAPEVSRSPDRGAQGPGRAEGVSVLRCGGRVC